MAVQPNSSVPRTGERRPDDELRLGQVLHTFGSYLREWVRKWWVHLLVVGLAIGLMTIYLNYRTTSYRAQLTFVADDGSAQGGNPLSRIASTFGLGMGGGGGSTTSPDMLVDMLMSRSLIRQTLLTEATINGRSDLLYTHYRQLKHSMTDEVVESIDSASLAADPTELNRTITFIRKWNLDARVSDSGLISLFFETESEQLSQQFAIAHTENLSRFYADKTTGQRRESLQMMSVRVDSIQQLLTATEAELRAWLNQRAIQLRAGSLTPDEFMTKTRLEREAQLLANIYAEAITGRELAAVELESAKPLVQVIDYPDLPLEPRAPVPLVFYAVAVVAGLFLSTLLIVVNKLFRDALYNERTISEAKFERRVRETY